MIKKVKRKQEILEAIRWDGQNTEEIEVFMNKILERGSFGDEYWLLIENLQEGTQKVKVGCWIIKEADNEFYVYKPNVFKAIYEEVK